MDIGQSCIGLSESSINPLLTNNLRLTFNTRDRTVNKQTDILGGLVAVVDVFINWGSIPLMPNSPWIPFPSPPFFSFPFRSLSVPNPLHSPFFMHCRKSSYIGSLGERCDLPQRSLGWSPGRKHILTHLRVSKRTSWQHLSAPPKHFLWRKMRHSRLRLDAPAYIDILNFSFVSSTLRQPSVM